MNEELELEKLNDLAIHYPVYLIDAAAEHFNGDECKLEATLVTNATCTGEGVMEYHCVRCGEHKIEGNAAAGHVPGSAATCTEPQLCTKCGAVLNKALGHDYKTEITKPTCTEMGYTMKTCTRCGDSSKTDYNDLASQRPELADEWSERNAPLRPDKVMVFSNQKAWWRCKLGHEWNTLISTRAGGSKCPYCSGLKLMKGFNDLSSCYPELSREWSEKNGRLLPEDVNERSTKNVWWKCGTCGHEYKAVIKSRVHGLKCPVCTQRAVLAGYNDLSTTDPELVLEWDYDANERKPTEISRLSQYPVWWKGACGHKWKDKVFSRAVEGARCIYCEKEFVQVLPRLLVMVYAKRCGTKVSVNDEKTIGTLLDVLLPEVNLAFTFPSRETDRGAKVIEVMQYMCAARKIQLIEVRKKEPIELAHEIKQAFAKAHLYIDSDSEKEIDYLRKWYFHQTV